MRITVITLLLVLSHYSYSQNDTVNIEGVEIYGVRPEVHPTTPNPVQTLTPKKLEALPTTSVAEAIRNFSGVIIKDFGGVGGLKTVLIRSLGANHTSVFIDGFPQTDATTGQIDLGKISLQNTSNISLSVGQAFFSLKPARMYSTSGVLQISSRPFPLSDKKENLGILFRYGSFGTVNPHISYDRNISPKITSGISLNYYNSTGKFPFQYKNGVTIEEYTRTNSDIESFDGLFKTEFVVRDSAKIKVNIAWYKSERGLPGPVILYNPRSSQRLSNSDINAGIQYSSKISSSISSLTTGGYIDSRLVYKDPDFLNQNGGLRNNYYQKEYYVSEAINLRASKRFLISAATDIIFNTLQSNAYKIKKPTRFSSLSAIAGNYNLKRTEIEAGVLLTIVKDDINSDLPANGSVNFLKVSPSFSVIHAFNENKTIKGRLSFKSAFRMPTFNDLYYTISGNNELKPENASLTNLGMIVNKELSQFTSMSFRMDGFLNIVSDKIIAIPTRNLFIWSTQNIGKVEIRGIELFAGAKHAFNNEWVIDLSGNYTFQNAVDITDKSDEKYGNQLPYIPFETAGVLTVLYYNNLSLGLDYLYNGYRYTTASNEKTGILSSWSTFDLVLSKQWQLKKMKLVAKAEVTNLLNHQYEVVKSFPMTGRATFVSVSAFL